MFGWREVALTTSMTDCAKIREALYEKGIRYRYRIRNTYGDPSRRLGTFDVDMNYAFQYYLYVKKQDYDQATQLLQTTH